MPTTTVKNAIEHMSNGGELRIYVGSGEQCQSPPPAGSGVIISDIGRVNVSRLTIKRLREIGTQYHYRNYKYGKTRDQDTYESWETLKQSSVRR